MRTPLAKIAFIIMVCCLITLVVGAETPHHGKTSIPSVPTEVSSPAK